MNEELKPLFTPGPFVSLRSSRKISSYLVKVLPVRLQEKLTNLIINLTTWRNAWFISLLVTNVENNIWVKQLTLLATGGKNYRYNSRKHAHGISCMQEHLYEHFCDSEHSGFLNDVSITFIDKTDPTNPLQSENYWKHTLKTFAP